MSLVGKCLGMCPQEEINQRLESDFSAISPFECDFQGNFRPELAIKTFHRSEASREFKPEEIRPINVLQKTLDHIFSYVIGQKLNTGKDTSEIQMFHYVNDKLRSIKNDIILQSLLGSDVISIYETNILFYIWAGIRFYQMDISDFDPVQNMEQITQTFLSLDEQYDMYFQINNSFSPNEFFFRPLNMLTYLERREFMYKLSKLKSDIINSHLMKVVIKLEAMIKQCNIVGFLKSLSGLPIQFVCYALINSSGLWVETINNLRIGFNKNTFPISFIREAMQITDPHSFEQWCNAFNIVLTDGDCNFDVQKSPDLSVLPNLVVPEEISLNPCVQNCIKFVKSLNVQEESQQIHIDSIPPEKPVFTQQLVIEQPPVEERNEQIIQKVVISEERPLKLPDQVTEVPQILRIPEIPKPIPKKEKAEALAIPSPPLKNAKEITEKIEDKIRYSEISAMIPNSIPQMSFSTVLLIADDGSPSSNYAINKFDFIDSQTAICGKLTNQSSICYILVTRNRDHPTISSILNCQEIYPLEYSQVPVITFKEDFGFSSRCAFLSCLRRSIIEGIIEFRPFDVSYLVITILSRIREIVLTSSWRNSTANSVLSLFNNGFELISKSLLSEEFISFLIPFEHGLLTYEMIEKYSFQIKGMRMKLLSTVQSNQRLQGTSWPMHITQAMKLNVPKFVAPMSTAFSPDAFVESVVNKLKVNIDETDCY